MKIKLERFSYEEIPQIISWVPDKEFLLQWAGPSYSSELLDKQLRNDIDLMLEEDPKSLMFCAKYFS